MGALQWARVATKHESNGYPNRSANVLKRRYQGLLKKANQVPTGNPHLPEEIKRVREVQAALRTAARAADPSQENGGVSAMFHGTNVVTSENAQQVASDLEESTSTYTGLDGPRPLTTIKDTTSKTKLSPLEMIARAQAQTFEQQVKDRKIERKRLRQEREASQRTMDSFLHLAAMGMYAWIGSQDNAASNPATKVMGELVKDMVKTNKKKRSAEDGDDDSIDSDSDE